MVVNKQIVLSGSFNPLHDGHLQLMKSALTRYPSHEPLFELSLHNADKGGITDEMIEKRVKQFSDLDLRVALTNAPLFKQKS